MAPPKQSEESQNAIKTRVHTRSSRQAEEGEQQPSEIVNIDKIASLERASVHLTPILEEIQQTTLEGMNIDIPT
jgi:hypothetical protein